MWSQFLLCLLVGLAYASNNPAWKDNTEYVYQVRGRTLASLHDVADQYSGILLKAKLTLQPRTEGDLYGKLSEVKYGQVHTQLPGGWMSHIPDSELSYKDLPMSGKAFKIQMKNGVVRNLFVEKEVQNWEANIIKSIVSQFQLDTNAENLIQSHVNTLPDTETNTGVFKTMEETVTGKTETLYDIHLMPEHILASKPWLVPQPELKGDGYFIEIVKNKNFTSSVERPLFHYGLNGLRNWEPASNDNGEFFVRNSISRAVISGNLKRYTVQSAYTINQIVMSPTLNDKQKGSVNSILNVTLSEVRSQSESHQELANPVELGSLVYRYNQPFSTNEARPMEYQQQQQQEYDLYHSSEERLNSPVLDRFRRNLQEDELRRYSEESWQTQEQPKMNVAPATPLLPLTVGYKGNSIKKDSNFNIVQEAQKLAKQIGQDLQEPETMIKEDVLSKYILLTGLTRLMDKEEYQQVAEQLYTQSQEGPQRAAWVAYRDAVAESGTGPAQTVIMQWIESQKIKHTEAAEVIVAMAANVRQPTEEYMRNFFAFIKKPEIINQETLNDTAILAYTNLVRRVYINKHESHNQYPVHAFGSFRTQAGRTFVKNEVIPYLTQQLKDSINRADSQKVHVYIRALGNVAHREILSAFEPYLEGQKQCSQFQRLLMVLSMDQLVRTNPIVARSVLYKIYQNQGEAQEVRVAAVYQLIRTAPPTDMLQRMAAYTHTDISEHVNAAVKSVIESAAQLEGEQFQYLRSSAKAALPLLTKTQYGSKHGLAYIFSYVSEELKVNHKHDIEFIPSEDSFLPKGIKFAFRDYFSKMGRDRFEIQSLISSVEELADITMQQTQWYEKYQQQAQQQTGNEWSSENIARLLNWKSDEREQLEGILRVNYGYLEKLWSINNQTIEQLPEFVRYLEESLKAGKTYQYTKLMSREDIVISFPTETGFPFLYTYNVPTLIKVEAKVKAESQPQIAQQQKLYQPESVRGTIELHATLKSDVKARLMFVTPFDHQLYIAGYNKVMQVHIPLRNKFHLDIKNKQIEIEMESLDKNEKVNLIHCSSWPYTSKTDIMTMQPISQRPTTQVIKDEDRKYYNHVVGKEYTGIALRVEMESKQEKIDFFWLSNLLQKRDPHTILMALMDASNIQYHKMNIYYLPQESTTQKLVLRMGYDRQYRSQYQEDSNDSQVSSDLSKISNTPTETRERLQEFIKRVSTGIHSVDSTAFDAAIEFQGAENKKYIISAAMGKSNVDPKSKVLVYFQKKSQSGDSKPYIVGLSAKSYIPNTNGLDLADSMKHEPTANTMIHLSFGNTYETAAKIQAQIDWHRSEERKQYLLQDPMYHHCKQEMQQGNHQLPACNNMTIRANYLDRAQIKLHHEQLHPEVLEVIRAIYESLRVNYFPVLKVSRHSGEQKQVTIETRYNRDFSAVNVTVKTPQEETKFENLYVREWVRPIVRVHPVFHLRTRLISKFLGVPTLRPICVVDQTATSTFNNRTYPITTLGNSWTVMFQYVPQQARRNNQQGQQQHQSVEQQLKQQIHKYNVLVRHNKDNQVQKDVKITVAVPETEMQLIDITLQPSSKSQSDFSSSNPAAKVYVDGKEVKVNDKESTDVKHGFVQIYAIRNGEVKVEVRGAFYVIYDGSRVKLTILDGKFRNAVRGLCGQYNDDKTTDFLVPENCIARDVRDFIQSYQVQQGQQRSQNLHDNKKCYHKEILYANVISDLDAGRDEKHQQMMGKHSGMCLTYQTRYVEQGGEICFSIRPMPVCHCTTRDTVTKNVAVHCVQKSNVAQLWKNQIDKGASPDFSHKKETKSVQMELPKSCNK